MALNREESRRAEGYGYYSSYGVDAKDVLGYLEGDLVGVENTMDDYSGKSFKVTIIVEEV